MTRKRYGLTSPSLGRAEERALLQAVRSGWLTHRGRCVGQFERRFAAFSGCRHGVATNSGTAAIHLALSCLDIGPGDEVIMPALTYVATGSAILYTGASPVFVDVERDSWCIDAEAVRGAITRQTKAILAVHLYGQPANMDRLTKIASVRDIPLIGDAAQAHGATYHDKPIGAFADVTAYSFHGSKLVATGEGGMLVTSRKRLADRARFLGNHASYATRPYWHDEIGFSYRLTNPQGALGLAQLKRIPKALAARRRIMEWYREELDERPDLELNPIVASSRSACWLVCVLLPEDGRSVDRVRKKLARQGIETRPVFPPVNSMPPFREYRSVGACGVTRMLSQRGIVLPSGGALRRSDVRSITKRLLRAVG